MDNEALVKAVAALNESVLVLSMTIMLFILCSTVNHLNDAIKHLNDNQAEQNRLLNALPLQSRANVSSVTGKELP